jgi:hypothetical protein
MLSTALVEEVWRCRGKRGSNVAVGRRARLGKLLNVALVGSQSSTSAAIQHRRRAPFGGRGVLLSGEERRQAKAAARRLHGAFVCESTTLSWFSSRLLSLHASCLVIQVCHATRDSLNARFLYFYNDAPPMLPMFYPLQHVNRIFQRQSQSPK